MYSYNIHSKEYIIFNKPIHNLKYFCDIVYGRKYYKEEDIHATVPIPKPYRKRRRNIEESS